MKTICCLFVFSLLFTACKKSESTVNAPTNPVDSISNLNIPYPLNSSTNCANFPDYGDSIEYAQPFTAGQYTIIHPINSLGAGTYLSWPLGLVLDAATGAINVSLSQTGQRYQVGFVSAGSRDTCLHELILAGYSYIDSIYDFSLADTIAAPYFNANPYLASICAQGGGCRFDISGKGRSKGIKINPETGVINLKDTKKVFGKNPYNGQVVQQTILYSLNDNSHQAIQQLTIDLIYYDRKSSIPQNVVDLISAKRNNILNNQLISTTSNPKPPLIIITRVYQKS